METPDQQVASLFRVQIVLFAVFEATRNGEWYDEKEEWKMLNWKRGIIKKDLLILLLRFVLQDVPSTFPDAQTQRLLVHRKIWDFLEIFQVVLHVQHQ